MRQRLDTRANSTAAALPAHAAGQGLRGILLLAAITALLLASVLSADAAPAFPDNIPLPNGWAPEGIATGRGTDFYVGSLANGGIYKGDLRTGTGAVLVEGVVGRSIVGIKVDARTNYIFASGRTSGKAFVFDAATGALLAEFRRLGWKPKPGKGGSGFDKPHVRKIYALWREAGVVGAIDNASKEALRAFVARQTGKDAPEFCSPSEANKVSEGLKAMIRRAEARR